MSNTKSYLGAKRRLAPKKYHLIVTYKHRNLPVSLDLLKSLDDFLSQQLIIVYHKFHNDGKHNQLHSHYIVTCDFSYRSIIRNLKACYACNAHFSQLLNKWDIKRCIKYINQSHSPKQVMVWQEQILDENYFRHFYNPDEVAKSIAK